MSEVGEAFRAYEQAVADRVMDRVVDSFEDYRDHILELLAEPSIPIAETVYYKRLYQDVFRLQERILLGLRTTLEQS
jgi:hypothetical protein